MKRRGSRGRGRRPSSTPGERGNEDDKADPGPHPPLRCLYEASCADLATAQVSGAVDVYMRGEETAGTGRRASGLAAAARPPAPYRTTACGPPCARLCRQPHSVTYSRPMWIDVAAAAVAMVVALNLLVVLLLGLSSRSALPELHQLPGSRTPSLHLSPAIEGSAERDRPLTSRSGTTRRYPRWGSLIFGVALGVLVGRTRATK